MKNRKNLMVLLGPTAIGKTAISIDVAKKINGEIISADSMQIYKYMDIGTAKVSIEEMDNIPHYMIDIVYPDEEFTVANFKQRAENHIEDISSRGKLPMVVGGTGLYLNSLVYELNFVKVKPNQEIRNKYSNLADVHGNQYIHDILSKIDPISSNRINPNDRKRIIRAIEIFLETKKPMSYYNKNFRKETNKYNLIMIGLTMDRAKLYSRINKRIDIMIEEGLIQEVKMLMDMGYNKNFISMQGIGYKEIISYLENETDLDTAVEILKRNTRKYAKRQLTWFRRDNRINWINIEEFNSIESVSEYIINYVKKTFVKTI